MMRSWGWRRHWIDAERQHALHCVIEAMGLDTSRRESVFSAYYVKTHGTSEAATRAMTSLSEDARRTTLEAFSILGDIEESYRSSERVRSPILEGAVTLVSSWNFDDEWDIHSRLGSFMQMVDGQSLRNDWGRVGEELRKAIKRYATEGDPHVPGTTR